MDSARVFRLKLIALTKFYYALAIVGYCISVGDYPAFAVINALYFGVYSTFVLRFMYLLHVRMRRKALIMTLVFNALLYIVVDAVTYTLIAEYVNEYFAFTVVIWVIFLPTNLFFEMYVCSEIFFPESS